MSRYYYQLKDIVEGTPYSNYELSTELRHIGINTSSLGLSLPICDKVWQLVRNRYYKFYVFECDEDELLEFKKDFFYKVCNILVMTFNKYNALLSAYADAEGHLMDSIKSTSKNQSLYNDTPQDLQTSADNFLNENHVTNATTGASLNETEGASKMSRLNELESYNNILANWSDEFDKLFIYEGNI